jgi:hypothetical protein
MFPTLRPTLSKKDLLGEAFLDIAPEWLFVLHTLICSQAKMLTTMSAVTDDLSDSFRSGTPAVMLPYLIDHYYGALIFFHGGPRFPTAILVVDGFQKNRELSPVMQQLLTHFTSQLPIRGFPALKKTWGLLKVPREFTYQANQFPLFITRLEQLFGYLDLSIRRGASLDTLIHLPQIVSLAYDRSLMRTAMKMLDKTPIGISHGVDQSWYDDHRINKLTMLVWRNLYESNPMKAQRVGIFPVQPLHFYGTIFPNIADLLNLNSAFVYTNDPSPYEKPRFQEHLEKRISDFDLLIFPLIVAAETKDFEKLNQVNAGQVCNHYVLVILRKLPDGRYEFYYQCPLGESSFYSVNKKLAWERFSHFFPPIVLTKKEIEMTAQQNNSYDCGVWLIHNIEHALTSNWDDSFGSGWSREVDIVTTRALHDALLASLDSVSL